MLAARMNAYGPPESLVVEDLPDLVPGTGQVVVGVATAAVNFPDVLIMANKYQVSVPVPFTPGSEFAGTVLRVGESVDRVRVGDAVYGSTFVGAFAEQVCVSASAVQPVPVGFDFTSAAAVGVTYRTSYHALRSVADAKPGEWVAVLGAAGGVGSAAVDIAHRMGCKVLAAASSTAKLEVCRQLGADALVNYRDEDLKVRMKELTGEGVDVVIDPVGGPYAEAALRSTRWGGRFVTVGFASGEIPRIPLNLVLLKGVIVKGFEIRTFSEHAPEDAERDEAELAKLFAQGLRPHVSATYPLKDAGQALNDVGAGKTTGKVIIAPCV